MQIGRFLFNLFDLFLLMLDVIMSTSLLLPELLCSYASSFVQLLGQLMCLILPARLVDYLFPTLRQPKRHRSNNQAHNQSNKHNKHKSLVHSQRAFYISEAGELFRTEELTIDPLCNGHDQSVSHGPKRQSLQVSPLEKSSSNKSDVNKEPSSNNDANSAAKHHTHPSSSTPSSSSSSPIVLFMITGNPGSCHYYSSFLQHLSRISGQTMHIRCVSFVGHQSIKRSTNQSDTHPRLYGLPDQLSLWKSVITQTLTDNPGCRVILCGHSIGAWIALHLMPQIPAEQLLHSYLLFPAIMDMARTPDGAKLLPIFQSFRTPIAMLSSVLSTILPQMVVRVLIRANLGSGGEPETDIVYETEHVVDTTVRLFKYSVIQQMLHLAHTELEIVREMPRDLIARFENKITLLCATVDAWNPPSHQHLLAAEFPRLRIRMMAPSVKHAFVIGSARLVASALWQEMRKIVDPMHETSSSDSEEDDLFVTSNNANMYAGARPLH